MQLQFGPDDSEEFAAAKQEILDAFGTWTVQRYGDDDRSLVADADTFLSWRFDYSTGDLSDFDIADVEEFLLGWAPRKFSVGPEAAPSLGPQGARRIQASQSRTESAQSHAHAHSR